MQAGTPGSASYGRHKAGPSLSASSTSDATSGIQQSTDTHNAGLVSMSYPFSSRLPLENSSAPGIQRGASSGSALTFDQFFVTMGFVGHEVVPSEAPPAYEEPTRQSSTLAFGDRKSLVDPVTNW